MKKSILILGLLTLCVSCERTADGNLDDNAPMTEQDSTIQDIEEASEVILLH